MDLQRAHAAENGREGEAGVCFREPAGLVKPVGATADLVAGDERDDALVIQRNVDLDLRLSYVTSRRATERRRSISVNHNERTNTLQRVD